MSRLLVVSFSLLIATSSFAAKHSPIDLSAEGARVHRAESLAPLTAPAMLRTDAAAQERADGRMGVVRSYLSQKGRGTAAQSLRTITETEREGMRHIRMEQRIGGLPVFGTYVKATLDSRGRVRSIIENIVDPAPIAPALISEEEAIASAVGFHYPARRADRDNAFWYQAPTATRVAIPMRDGVLVEGFLVETWEDKSNILRHTVVDADGAVVYTELRTATDTYKIYPDHPGNSTQTVVNGPGAGNAQSPSGWVTSNTTTGNNVDAYLDRDNNNAADASGRPVSATKNFEYTVDLLQAPTVSVNQMAAVTNLFYLNNVIHDKLYQHGFVESQGNFQTNNFGLGGAGNDSVRAEAQDGGGTNNANFSTPADGSRPRMQMYLWTSATPNRDGDLDSDIVWHEYGHGLTWRMIGSMTGPLAGALGEGMSDVLSIYINRHDRVGEYAYNNANGIRRFPYTNYPNTYGDVTGTAVHADGEIYAATMWKLLELWEAAGFTQNELFDRVIDGMNFTPARPAYEDMRDGLLAAMPTQQKDCLVWNAFAQFGIGQGANGVENCILGIFCINATITESFTKPAVCP